MRQNKTSIIVGHAASMHPKLTPLALSLMLACSANALADTASTNRETDLQAQSQADAAVLASLAARTKVDVLKRSGAWTQVKTNAGQTGWVRMFSLTFDAGNNGSGNSTAVANLVAGGRTSSTGVGTSGAKALGEQDLRNAVASQSEFDKMQRLAVDKSTAQGFAQRAHFVRARIEYWFDVERSGKPGKASAGSEDE